MSALEPDVRTSTRGGKPLRRDARITGAGIVRRSLIVAGLVALIIAAAVYVVRTRPGPARADAPLEGYSPEPGTYLVLPASMTDGASDSDWLRDGLSDIISSELTNNPGVRVVARSTALAAVRAGGLADRASLSLDAALSLARGLRAERLVTSELRRSSERFTVRIALVDVGAGRVVHEVVEEATRRDELVETCLAAGAQLVRELPRSPSYGLREALSPVVPTRSEDAYRAYIEARVAEALGGRDGLNAADQRLEDAIQADPAFASAYVQLALVRQRLRWLGLAAKDPRPPIVAAMALDTRLTDRERGVLRGLAAVWVESHPEDAVEHWATVLQAFPAFALDAAVPVLLAETQASLGRWDDVIQVALPNVDAPSMNEGDRAPLSAWLARAFSRRGEHGRAVAYGTRAVEAWPARDGAALLRLRVLVGRILVDGGNRERALEMFRAVAADPRADAPAATDAAWGLYLAGDRGSASRVLDQALQLDGGFGPAYHLRAWLRLTAGEYDGAASDFREAYERTTADAAGGALSAPVGRDLVALYYEGVAHQKAGRPAEALAAWRGVIGDGRQAATTRNPVQRWRLNVLSALAAARMGQSPQAPERIDDGEPEALAAEARLHALLGQRANAVECMRNAVSLGLGDLQRVLDEPDFDALRATPDFVRIVQGAQQPAR